MGELSVPRSRAATATSPSAIAVAIFLASWLVLWGALLLACTALRLRAELWPPPVIAKLSPLAPALATAAIIASSLLLWRGHNLLAAAAGKFFLAAQIAIAVWMWRSGVRIDADIYGAILWVMVGFHAVHAAIGIAGLAWTTPNTAWKAYWHTIGIAWLPLYALLYLP